LFYYKLLKDGDRFWKIPECYIRGNSIKYLRIPDDIIDLVSEEEAQQRERKKYKLLKEIIFLLHLYNY
jgi:hypothetical protein